MGLPTVTRVAGEARGAMEEFSKIPPWEFSGSMVILAGELP